MKSMEDPFALKIKELSRLGDATRILNALKGNDFYDGDPEKLAKCKPEDIRKINGLGTKSVCCHCQGIGRHGVHRECGGMVEVMRVGNTEDLKWNDSKYFESISVVRYSQ